MGNAGPQNAEATVGSLMDGVLLLANANQELNYRRRELMRPQLNANYRHLCSPSNPVTSLLFGDDLPKPVKDISDTNRLSSKLTKDSSSTRALPKAVNHAPIGRVRGNMMVLVATTTSSQKTTRAPSTSEGSRRGRRRATKFDICAEKEKWQISLDFEFERAQSTH